MLCCTMCVCVSAYTEPQPPLCCVSSYTDSPFCVVSCVFVFQLPSSFRTYCVVSAELQPQLCCVCVSQLTTEPQPLLCWIALCCCCCCCCCCCFVCVCVCVCVCVFHLTTELQPLLCCDVCVCVCVCVRERERERERERSNYGAIAPAVPCLLLSAKPFIQSLLCCVSVITSIFQNLCTESMLHTLTAVFFKNNP